jgi:uncharacterized protein YeaC (DUF1315 family)
MSASPDLQALLDNITPDVYEALKRAVELGKWPNGVRLTSEQRETCLQAVIYYDGRCKPEQERVGFIHPKEEHGQPKEHEHCGSDGDKEHDHAGNRWDDEQLLVFRDMVQNNPVKH